MTSDFAKLGEVAEVIDSLHKTPEYSEVGYPMVRCTDVKYGRLSMDGTLRVDGSVFKEFSRRYKPQQNDIIITRVGSYGNTALVEDTNFCLGQNTAAIVPKINPRFLYFVLNSPQVKRQIEYSVVGSTQKTLSLKAINNLDIPRFDPSVEDRIAEIVGSIDDKIELNRQINQTLEQIAQAIFKSWFVDFEPVKAKIEAKATGHDPECAAKCAISGKLEPELDQIPPEQYQQLAATAALFPDELVESELGLIPEGWTVCDVYGVSGVIYGAPFKSKKFNSNGVGKPLIRIRDLQHEAPGVYTPEVHPKGYLVPPGDIIAGMDGEFRSYIWGGEEAWLNQRVCVFKPKTGIPAAFVRCSIMPCLASVELSATATTVIHLGKKDIDRFRLVNPELNVMAAFGSVVEPLYAQIVSLKQSSRSLATLRDTLLPKLLSGDLTSDCINGAETLAD